MYNGGAQMANLPYDKQLIIEFGIPLFELEKRSTSRMDTNDMGYANCKATKNDNSRNQPITIRWFAGRSGGYVRYSRDPNNRYIGYCPDDPEWFNRIKLCTSIENSNFKIAKYITEDGLIIVGSEITDEINLIRNELTVWTAKIDGSVVIRSKNELEVKEYVNKKRIEGIAIQGPIRVFIEKIERIRDNHKHDWIFSPEFQNEIIPSIKEKINKKFNRDVKELKDKQPEFEAAVSKLVPQFLNNMSIKQLTDIVKKKMADQAKDGIIKNGKLFLDDVPLERLKINKIRTVAVKKFGILTEGKTREELIHLINEKIKATYDNDNKKEESDDVNDIVGPPTPEEIKNRELAGLQPLETVETI